MCLQSHSGNNAEASPGKPSALTTRLWECHCITSLCRTLNFPCKVASIWWCLLSFCQNCHFSLWCSDIPGRRCTWDSVGHLAAMSGFQKQQQQLLPCKVELARGIHFYQPHKSGTEWAFLPQLTQMLGSVCKGTLKGTCQFLPAQLLPLTGSWAWIFMAVNDRGWHLFGTSSGQTFLRLQEHSSCSFQNSPLLVSSLCSHLTRRDE